MKITSVFSAPAYAALFLLIFAFLTAVYFVVTGIYAPSVGEFVSTVEPIRVVFLLLIAALSSLALTIFIYKKREPLVCTQNAPAFLGSFAALFTTACPLCFPLLLSWVGVGGATALAISSNAVPIQLASVALLGVSIYYATR